MATASSRFILSGLLDRGDLPSRIEVLLPWGGCAIGDVYVWSESGLGYFDACGRDCVIPAFMVCAGMERGVFGTPRPRQEALALTAQS
jgi:hypothetical protein